MIKTTKLIFLIAFLLIFSANLFSQGLRYHYVIPLKDTKVLFDRSHGFSLEYKKRSSEYSQLMAGARIGYHSMPALTDTLYSSDLSDLIIYEKNDAFSFFVTTEFELLPTDFTPFIGLDFGITYHSVKNYISENDGAYRKSFEGWEEEFAIIPRFGFSYEYDVNWLISVGVARNLGTLPYTAYWMPYFSINYVTEHY